MNKNHLICGTSNLIIIIIILLLNPLMFKVLDEWEGLKTLFVCPRWISYVTLSKKKQKKLTFFLFSRMHRISQFVDTCRNNLTLVGCDVISPVNMFAISSVWFLFLFYHCGLCLSGLYEDSFDIPYPVNVGWWTIMVEAFVSKCTQIHKADSQNNIITYTQGV